MRSPAPLRAIAPAKPSGLGRRGLLAAAASLALPAAPGFAALARGPALPVHPFPHGAQLLLAGPPRGLLDAWSLLLAPALRAAIPPGPPIIRHLLGGRDGVTAANRFAAVLAPAGETLLMMPGEAARAWAVGDPRVHYEVGHWVPLLAATTPGVLVGRDGAVLRAGRRLTLAAATPVGADLAAFLALELLGVAAAPLFGLATPAARRAAFLHRAADLVFLTGPGVPAQLAALARVGGRALFSLGAPTATGEPGRDPLLPRLPSVGELYLERTGHLPSGPFAAAFAAMAAASRLAFGLALPGLTPAALVALWRLAASAAAAAPALAAAAHHQDLRLAVGPLAIAEMAPLAASTQALLALRHFLAARLGWHPR